MRRWNSVEFCGRCESSPIDVCGFKSHYFSGLELILRVRYRKTALSRHSARRTDCRCVTRLRAVSVYDHQKGEFIICMIISIGVEHSFLFLYSTHNIRSNTEGAIYAHSRFFSTVTGGEVRGLQKY